ncbi:2-nitropropane dioxygenase [Fulvivirga imtechensis AK7]|uniref:2-nitropropane dioxygenase n=1 Tax=Fulvivirga imtechensis AK7 TaxID=1237149 RepID=L8JXA0_9BACT|nr:nitronate monooxygenase [Fulvivirga imtechensis]ELR72234.1 2-nitropropane dioxygenase [Fulvivirga imtechensis AK7]
MEKINTELTQLLDIKYPIIMAPMFLVSNTAMTIEGIKAGITGAIPALNYRTDKEFRAALSEIKNSVKGPFGINLIVNKSNYRLDEQLKTCVEYKVDFIITSLGSPKKVIEACREKGIKVFCDVTEEKYAQKVEALGADALIAVNSSAGGHAGNMPPGQLIPLLRSHCRIPVISAGGVGTGGGLRKMLELGACGISMGSPFIASVEAGVSQEYKQAIVDYGANDIVMTDRLSGTPCTVINTPYVQQIGTKQSWLESLLNKNRTLKKYAKMLTFYKGMKSLEKAAFSATYKTLWCAGPSIEHVKDIRSVKEIVATLADEYYSQAEELAE